MLCPPLSVFFKSGASACGQACNWVHAFRCAKKKRQGVRLQAELSDSAKAIRELGGELLSAVPVHAHEEKVERFAVLIRKTAKTRAKYPRANGIPNKKPL